MRPTLCLAMIVRNEAEVVCETLSRVVDLIDCWVVCDTGSTDGTREKIKNFFAEKKVPGELYDDVWENFAHNRTLAFARSHRRADYVWVLDADDLLTGVPVFPIRMDKDAYSLVYGNDTCIRFQRPQLFSTRLEWEYRGVVHEFPCRVDSQPYTLECLLGDYFVDYLHSRLHTTNDRGKNPLKYLRDAQRMEKALATENNKVYYWRYVYYIGQSYFDYGDFAKAITFFRQHIVGVRNADTYFCYFYIAGALQRLDQKDHEAEIMENYLRGYVLEPQRAECPYFLARLHFESARYEKALSVLALCKDLPQPECDQKVLSSVYRFDAKWLYLQTCRILGKAIEEEKTWRQLFFQYPEVVEKVDVRLYPTAVRLLSNTHPFAPLSPAPPFRHQVALPLARSGDEGMSSLYQTLTDPHNLVCVDDAAKYRFHLQFQGNRVQALGAQTVPEGDGGLSPQQCPPAQWLFLRPWSVSSVVSRMLDRGVSTMHLCHGETLFEMTRANKPLVWVRDTQCLLPPKEEWWSDALCTRYPLASCESFAFPDGVTTVTLGIGSVTVHDFLSAFFLFALCDELGFRFRFSTRTYRGAMSFCGQWSHKNELCEFLRAQPILATGNFFRLEWLSPDYRTSVWPRFREFMGACPVPTRIVDEAFDPRHLSELLGADSFVIRQEDHAVWPLVAHLVVLLDVGFSSSSPGAFLNFECVPSDIRLACWTRPVSARVNAMNEVLAYTPSVDLTLCEDEGLMLWVDEDFILSEPFLTWQLRFMDIVRNVRQWDHPWSMVNLLAPGPSEITTPPFRLVSPKKKGPTFHYPLFRRAPKEKEGADDFVFFPRLHFVDSEVYFSTVPRPCGGAGFDAYNALGFYKKWVPGRVQHFELDMQSEYPGDWVAASHFRTGYSPVTAWKCKRCPVIPKDQMPLYGIGNECIRRVPRSKYVHLDLWQSLVEDGHHDYYMILEGDARFSKMPPYVDDLEGNLSLLVKSLAEKPSWDILVLGTGSTFSGTEKSNLSLERLEAPYVKPAKGYLLHKKTAAFLLGVVQYGGLPDRIDDLWTYHALEKRFLDVFWLPNDLVVG